MPKLKSNRATAKRFRATGSGFKHRCANRSHNFTSKSTKRKRHLRGTALIDGSDVRAIKRLLEGS